MKLMKVTTRTKKHLAMESAGPFAHLNYWISMERIGGDGTVRFTHSGRMAELRQCLNLVVYETGGDYE